MSDSDGIAAAVPSTGAGAPVISAVLAVSMLVVAASYVIHRAGTPSDGTRGGYVTSSLSADVSQACERLVCPALDRVRRPVDPTDPRWRR